MNKNSKLTSVLVFIEIQYKSLKKNETSQIDLVEWLTRCPAKAMLFERVGSNPAVDELFAFLPFDTPL